MITLTIEVQDAPELLHTLDFLALGLKQSVDSLTKKEEPLIKSTKTRKKRKVKRKPITKKHKYKFACRYCGNVFGTDRLKAKFCSHNCSTNYRWSKTKR